MLLYLNVCYQYEVLMVELFKMHLKCKIRTIKKHRLKFVFALLRM